MKWVDEWDHTESKPQHTPLLILITVQLICIPHVAFFRHTYSTYSHSCANMAPTSAQHSFIINSLILHHAIFSLMWNSSHGFCHFFSLFPSSNPRWMPAACWRRGWTLLPCSIALPKPFPTRPSMPRPSCSRARPCRPTTSWLAPASSTNTLASSSPSRLAPSTWSTGSSISPRTPWRCPGEQMAWLLQITPAFVSVEHGAQGGVLLCKSGIHGRTISVQLPLHLKIISTTSALQNTCKHYISVLRVKRNGVLKLYES